MITPLGKMLRRLREDEGERLYDMAEKLGVKSAFLSAVETGKKSPPEKLVNEVIGNYALQDDVADQLRQAAQCSVTSIKVDLVGSSTPSRELALSFARQFSNLEPDQVAQLLSVLGEASDVRSSVRSARDEPEHHPRDRK